MSPRRQVPSRLFFYAYRGLLDEVGQEHSHAAVASITPERFQIVHTFPPDTFERWELVSSAANAGKRWLFFHNLNTHKTMTGFINSDFQFVESAPPPAPPDHVRVLSRHGPYQFAAVDGSGFLLLAASLIQPAGHCRVTRAQVLPDGRFHPIHTSIIEIPIPASLIGNTSIVGLREGHAWLSGPFLPSPAPDTSTVYILMNGQIVSSRTWSPSWSGMVAHEDSLLLFDTFGKRGEICSLDAGHNLVTTAVLGPSTFPRSFYFVANAPRALLAYDYSTGWAQVRALGQGAFTPTTGANLSLSWGWQFITAC